MSHTQTDTTPAAIEALMKDVTPGSKWRVEGKPDPHGARYDCPRSALPMADLSDDEMANGVYLFGDHHPPVADLLSGKAKTPGMWLDAAKNRIRWLSRKLDALRDLVPALAAERDAAQQERDDARGDLLFMTENRNKWQDSATQRYFRAEKAEAEAAALRDEVTRLKEAEAWQLKMRADAMTRRHMNAPEDPHVAALCERHGYGAVIDAASRLWARKDSLGAFYVGGCIGFRSDDEARAALTSKGGEA